MVSLNSYQILPFAVALLVLHFPLGLGFGSNWHEVRVSELLPSSTCTRQKDPSRLTLSHRHGPCSPFRNTPNPNHAQILQQDSTRVQSLNSRKTKNPSTQHSLQASQSITVPDTAGGAFETGNYIVTVGFGTPKSSYPVGFDTGSDVSWIQCQPCNNCYNQSAPIFNPKSSKTYSSLSCNSSQCQSLDTESRSCYQSTDTCTYKVLYGDKSSTKGVMGLDTLTLMSDTIPNFLFGCGRDNKGLSSLAAGLLGLGRGGVSLASQLQSRYGSTFSYCLPSDPSSTGYLKIGGGAATNVSYTTMVYNYNYPSFYFLNLESILVAGERLPISGTVFSGPGTILDSGTVISRLPPSAYGVLRDTFKKKLMEVHSFPSAKALEILDTCYDVRGYETIKLPSIVLEFSGGAVIDVDFKGILYVADKSQACLAFAPNRKEDELVIIGNVQQRRYDVIYDVLNERIGFAANSCA